MNSGEDTGPSGKIHEAIEDRLFFIGIDLVILCHVHYRVDLATRKPLQTTVGVVERGMTQGTVDALALMAKGIPDGKV